MAHPAYDPYPPIGLDPRKQARNQAMIAFGGSLLRGMNPSVAGGYNWGSLGDSVLAGGSTYNAVLESHKNQAEEREKRRLAEEKRKRDEEDRQRRIEREKETDKRSVDTAARADQAAGINLQKHAEHLAKPTSKELFSAEVAKVSTAISESGLEISEKEELLSFARADPAKAMSELINRSGLEESAQKNQEGPYILNQIQNLETQGLFTSFEADSLRHFVGMGSHSRAIAAIEEATTVAKPSISPEGPLMIANSAKFAYQDELDRLRMAARLEVYRRIHPGVDVEFGPELMSYEYYRQSPSGISDKRHGEIQEQAAKASNEAADITRQEFLPREAQFDAEAKQLMLELGMNEDSFNTLVNRLSDYFLPGSGFTEEEILEKLTPLLFYPRFGNPAESEDPQGGMFISGEIERMKFRLRAFVAGIMGGMG